jgi:plasmid stabilization system protein ParE
MQIRWTEEAANDLERIADYLLIHTPDRASELVRTVYHAPTTLSHVSAQRASRQEGGHSRVGPGASALPRGLEVVGEVVFVVRILHGAQKWL